MHLGKKGLTPSFTLGQEQEKVKGMALMSRGPVGLCSWHRETGSRDTGGGTPLFLILSWHLSTRLLYLQDKPAPATCLPSLSLSHTTAPTPDLLQPILSRHSELVNLPCV